MKKIAFFTLFLLMFVAFPESSSALKCVPYTCVTVTIYEFDQGRNCENYEDDVCYVRVRRTICEGATCVPGNSNYLPGTCRIYQNVPTVVYSMACDSSNEVSKNWWHIEMLPGKPWCDYTRCFFCPTGGRPEAVWLSVQCPDS